MGGAGWGKGGAMLAQQQVTTANNFDQFESFVVVAISRSIVTLIRSDD